MDNLNDADEPNSTKSDIYHLIFMLGVELETAQNIFRISNIPTEWNTQGWPTILVLCRNYYNSVNPQGRIKHDSPSENNSTTQSKRAAHHKKVKQWFLDPVSFMLR